MIMGEGGKWLNAWLDPDKQQLVEQGAKDLTKLYALKGAGVFFVYGTTAITAASLVLDQVGERVMKHVPDDAKDFVGAVHGKADETVSVSTHVGPAIASMMEFAADRLLSR